MWDGNFVEASLEGAIDHREDGTMETWHGKVVTAIFQKSMGCHGNIGTRNPELCEESVGLPQEARLRTKREWASVSQTRVGWSGLSRRTHPCQGQEVGGRTHILQEAGIPLGKRALPATPTSPQGPNSLWRSRPLWSLFLFHKTL